MDSVRIKRRRVSHAVHIGKNVQNPNRYIVTLLPSITMSRLEKALLAIDKYYAPRRKAMQLISLPARSSPFTRPSIVVSGALLVLPFVAALLVRHPDQHPLKAESCLGNGLLQMLAITISHQSSRLFYFVFISLTSSRRPIEEKKIIHVCVITHSLRQPYQDEDRDRRIPSRRV